jgi:hypothetical protein
MRTKIASIIARVAPETKAAFEARASAQSVSPSVLLRGLVMAELSAIDKFVDLSVLPDQNRLGVEQTSLRLPGFLMDKVKDRAGYKGMSVGRWLEGLVQSNLACEPVLNEREVILVRGMNRQLAAIGRNVNQIARALNMDSHSAERSQVDLNILKEVPASIELARKVITRLIRNTQRGWVADEE